MHGAFVFGASRISVGFNGETLIRGMTLFVGMDWTAGIWLIAG